MILTLLIDIDNLNLYNCGAHLLWSLITKRERNKDKGGELHKKDRMDIRGEFGQRKGIN
jgi:hypothetical protein